MVKYLRMVLYLEQVQTVVEADFMAVLIIQINIVESLWLSSFYYNFHSIVKIGLTIFIYSAV